MSSEKIACFFLPLLVFVLLSTEAGAHRIRVFAYESGSTVYVEAAFSGGKPVVNAETLVQDEDTQEILLAGRTDGEGKFSFPVPEGAVKSRATLNIIVGAGEGHRSRWRLKAEEYLGASAAGSTALTDGFRPSPPSAARLKSERDKRPSPQVAVNTADMQRMIEDALDAELAPIKRTLAENSRRGPTLQDILGGIGYILGLAGVGAYFHARGTRKNG